MEEIKSKLDYTWQEFVLILDVNQVFHFLVIIVFVGSQETQVTVQNQSFPILLVDF